MKQELFEIQRIAERIKVDRCEHHERSLVYSVSAFFALGRQIRTSFEEKRQVQQTIEVPCSPLDWLKSIIINFEPALNFGWLRPKYKTLEKEIIIKQTSQYMNVYPVELSNPALRKRHFSLPTPYDWLTGEPPTRQDLSDSRRKLHEVKWSAGQLAPWMLDKDVTNDIDLKEYVSRTSRQ